MIKKETVEVVIPFPGFYESTLSHEIDSCLEDIATERGLDDGTQVPFDIQAAETVIAEQWVAAFNDLLHTITGVAVSFEFSGIDHPRFYNFETDRVFVDAEMDQLLELYACLDEDEMAEMARRLFTSRDGFISFYEPDWTTWGAPETWDHKHWFCALRAIADQKDEWALWLPYELDFDTAVDGAVDWDKLDREHPATKETE